MSPKFALYNPLTKKYLVWSKLGPVWIDHWKHATKWQSHFKAKLFMEENRLFGVVPIEVLPKKIDVDVPHPAKQGA